MTRFRKAMAVWVTIIPQILLATGPPAVWIQDFITNFPSSLFWPSKYFSSILIIRGEKEGISRIEVARQRQIKFFLIDTCLGLNG
ncbi:hypothetical protein SDJN03_18489, partial [Cucurbita argyrosperma subsp. sororia]